VRHARQDAQRAPRLVLAGGLAVDRAVQGDERVDAEDELAVDGRRLAPRVLEGDLERVALGELLDARGPDLVLDAELRQDRRALRRARREDQRFGKNSFASRAADSSASEPWTMFLPTSSA
jgi:hypothetical protein